MVSRAKIARHPIHPMLVPFVIAFFILAFIFDVLYKVSLTRLHLDFISAPSSVGCFICGQTVLRHASCYRSDGCHVSRASSSPTTCLLVKVIFFHDRGNLFRDGDHSLVWGSQCMVVWCACM